MKTPTTDPPTYADLGIDKNQAYRWQLESSLPEEQFEQHIAETIAAGDELALRIKWVDWFVQM